MSFAASSSTGDRMEALEPLLEGMRNYKHACGVLCEWMKEKRTPIPAEVREAATYFGRATGWFDNPDTFLEAVLGSLNDHR